MAFRQATPTPAGGVPVTITRALAAAQAFLEGTPMIVDVDGNYAEVAADPDRIDAISLAGCGADTSGFNITGEKSFPKGQMQGMTVKGTRWFAPYVGTLPVADGGQYGIVKDTDNEWKVDFAEITAVVVQLVGRRTDAPESTGLVEVVVLDAAAGNI